jgi:hypothetical protein
LQREELKLTGAFILVALALGATAVACVIGGNKAEEHAQTLKDSENEKY